MKTDRAFYVFVLPCLLIAGVLCHIKATVGAAIAVTVLVAICAACWLYDRR